MDVISTPRPQFIETLRAVTFRNVDSSGNFTRSTAVSAGGCSRVFPVAPLGSWNYLLCFLTYFRNRKPHFIRLIFCKNKNTFLHDNWLVNFTCKTGTVIKRSRMILLKWQVTWQQSFLGCQETSSCNSQSWLQDNLEKFERHEDFACRPLTWGSPSSALVGKNQEPCGHLRISKIARKQAFAITEAVGVSTATEYRWPERKNSFPWLEVELGLQRLNPSH